ncbi:MAG: ATP-NAD kinase family protein, partial [Candidatus Bathyarchaeia archaeon]
LKGTDGKDILEKARSLGARPVAPARAEAFLSGLTQAGERLELLAGCGMMGEQEAKHVGLECTCVGSRREETTSFDTKEAAEEMKRRGVDLLVFCGGDGTARDILDAVGMEIPVLGVPTGVKMHSAVFAVDPKAAARTTLGFLNGELPLRESEVMDVDESAYREGRLSAKLYGYLLTPYEPSLVQDSKMSSPVVESELHNQAAIALYIIEEMKPDVVYILGPGTTTRTITDLLGEKKTLLGVDLLLNKKILVKDVGESQILEAIRGRKAHIVVTPIGGQGFIFGRGNLQISPRVIRAVGLDNITVIATRSKLKGLRCLRVDTGDQALDDLLKGYRRVVTDYREEHVVKVE